MLLLLPPLLASAGRRQAARLPSARSDERAKPIAQAAPPLHLCAEARLPSGPQVMGVSLPGLSHCTFLVCVCQ